MTRVDFGGCCVGSCCHGNVPRFDRQGRGDGLVLISGEPITMRCTSGGPSLMLVFYWPVKSCRTKKKKYMWVLTFFSKTNHSNTTSTAKCHCRGGWVTPVNGRGWVGCRDLALNSVSKHRNVLVSGQTAARKSNYSQNKSVCMLQVEVSWQDRTRTLFGLAGFLDLILHWHLAHHSLITHKSKRREPGHQKLTRRTARAVERQRKDLTRNRELSCGGD